MSLATKYAIQHNISFADSYRFFGRKYPDAGYGCMFDSWLRDDSAGSYGSYGNGSAMRVSYVADAFEPIDTVSAYAVESAVCTHNHYEGIKGAQVTAILSASAKAGDSKESIFKTACVMYPRESYRWSPELSLDEIRASYKWDATCRGTVPVAVRCFYESSDFESCMRNVMSLTCDMDTMMAIAGPIAEEFYGGTGMDNDSILRRYLDDWLLERLYE